MNEELTFARAKELFMKLSDEDAWMQIELSQDANLCLQVYHAEEPHEGQFHAILMAGDPEDEEEKLLSFNTIFSPLEKVLAAFSINPDDAVWSVYQI